MLHSTSLLQLFIVLARVLSISLWSHSIFCHIHQTSYIALSNHFQVGYWPYITLIPPLRPYRNYLPRPSHLLDHFSFQCCSVGVVVFWPYSIAGCIIVVEVLNIIHGAHLKSVVGLNQSCTCILIWLQWLNMTCFNLSYVNKQQVCKWPWIHENKEIISPQQCHHPWAPCPDLDYGHLGECQTHQAMLLWEMCPNFDWPTMLSQSPHGCEGFSYLLLR